MNAPASLPRILVVDDSRIVRATIIKRIRDRYEVREEADGEAAWETLLVDPSIQLVVSDLSMPRLDGYGLVERIRDSKLTRIRDMPVIMVSGDEDETARQRAKDLGATDFITKGTGTAELLARLDSLIRMAHTAADLVEARSNAATDPASGLMSRPVLVRQAQQALAFAARHGTQVGILALSLDHFDRLVATEGADTAEMLLTQFAKMLAAVVRKEDALCRWDHCQFAIVTPGLDRRRTALFAERLCAAVRSAKIQHRGHPLQLTISIGTANCPFDGISDAEAILAVAAMRMQRGAGEGGDRVMGDGISLEEEAHPAIDEALRRLATGEAEALKGQLPRLGLRLLPLLQLMNQELRLGLPLAELESRLTAREGHAPVSSVEDQ